MFQNIKVDIIYYNTNTDFELEFNLCGCCRMRLLTDKAPDKKTLVKGLARAVSRSRVILIAGNLFGEDGVMELVARSIGKDLSTIDSKLYGISSGESIEIINGATPLVTPDGYFGGCIIESGPQSMVLLTDNKSIRKTVMSNLIHPYIEDLCGTELKAKAADTSSEPAVIAPVPPIVPPIPSVTHSTTPIELTVAEDNQDISPDTAEMTEEPILTEDQEENTDAPEEITEETAGLPIEEPEQVAEQIPSVNESDFIMTEDIPFSKPEVPANDEVPMVEEDLFIEPQLIKPGKAEQYNYSYAMSTNDDSYYHTEPDFEGMNKPHRSGNLPILIVAILLLLVFALLCYCIFYVPSQSDSSPVQYLQDIFTTLFGKEV